MHRSLDCLRATLVKMAGVLFLASAAGCAFASREFNYLGVPENVARTTEQQFPDIDSRLRGITTMSKVRTVTYPEYLRIKRDSRASDEQRHGDFLYFAVRDMRDVPLPNAGPGDAVGAFFQMVERYRTQVPSEQSQGSRHHFRLPLDP